jgi:cystathionine beta-lyase
MHPLRELTLEDLRRRTSIKWREHEPDVLPLWVAEMDVRLADPIARAVAQAVADGDTGYPHGTAYAEAYAAFAADRWSWSGVDPSRTSLVADVMTGIVEALGLVSSPGDPVVVNPPVYPPFFGFVEHAGREIVEAPLGEGGRLDLEALEAAFIHARSGGRPVTYLLCNPQNPTAVVHTAEELSGVAALARTYDVRVVVDEIHGPLVPDGFVPYLSLPGTGDAFALVSASKAWNLAGMKAALLVAGEDAAADLARLPEVVGHGPSHFGVLAHSTAYREGGAWLDGLHADLAANRVLLAELLAKHLPEARWGGGPGTFLAWIDCRELGLGDDPAAAFLEQGRVAVNSGLPFHHGEGHVRLNFGTTPEILTEALERMGRVVGKA